MRAWSRRTGAPASWSRRCTPGPGTPAGSSRPSWPGRSPESELYAARTFFRPYDRLGNHWFGGDWFAGRADKDALWVIVADVTGHGYFAYLLACGLPDIWARTWQALGRPDPHPAEV